MPGNPGHRTFNAWGGLRSALFLCLVSGLDDALLSNRNVPRCSTLFLGINYMK